MSRSKLAGPCRSTMSHRVIAGTNGKALSALRTRPSQRRAVQAWLAVLVDGQGVTDEDHGSSRRGRDWLGQVAVGHRRAGGDDAVDQGAEVLDLGPDHVAGPQGSASAGPTPAGVPVETTSPGSRVTAWLAAATSVPRRRSCPRWSRPWSRR